MATSETQICNLGLAHVGNSNQIASLTEKSNEARACLLWYEQCRDEVLGKFTWPFATLLTTLQLVEENPTDEWAFSYRYPSNALTVTRIPSGFDRYPFGSTSLICLADWPGGWPCVFPRTPIPFRVVEDDSGKLIYTDLENATIEYTKRETDVTRYPADFVAALSYLIGARVAPLVTGGDPFKLGPAAMQNYLVALSDARVRAANEQGQDPPPESDFTRSRY